MPVSNRICRRSLLRGAGVTLTLPWLEAMQPRNSRAAEAAEPPPPADMEPAPFRLVEEDTVPTDALAAIPEPQAPARVE